MTPAEVKSIIAIIEMMAKMGAWPIALFMVGPWIFAMMLVWITERNSNKRHQAVVDMYISNAKLVEDYERLCKAQNRLEDDLKSMILTNTQAMTRLTDVIDRM